MSKFLLKASKNILTQKLLCDVYYAHFYSHLIYGIETWGPMMSKKNLDRLFKIQKATVRIITNSKYNAHTDPIFRNNKLLKLNDIIIKFQMCKFGYKLDHKIHPRPLLNIFKKNLDGLSRNRQVTHHMNIPIISKHSSKLYNSSYLCKSISNWTKLPQSVKSSSSSSSIFSFKRSCFTHLTS